MVYEEPEVAQTETVDPVTGNRVVQNTPAVQPTPVVQAAPAVEPTVVQQRPTTRIVNNDDPIGNVYAATQLIQTIIWSIVVIVLLVVVLLALHVYAHLF